MFISQSSLVFLIHLIIQISHFIFHNGPTQLPTQYKNQMRTYQLISLLLIVSLTSCTYYTTCTESPTRTCPYGTNITARLLAMKKGTSFLASTNTYDSNFFLCEEYNYNCGYLESQTDFLTIANGVQLNITYAQLTSMISVSTANIIKPYLASSGSSAKCLSSFFPLVLTDAQSNEVMGGYLNALISNLSTSYNTRKAASAPTWTSLNINLITAVLEMGKYYMNDYFMGTPMWNSLLTANYAQMSMELKDNYTTQNCPECLHSAYLIDSISSTTNRTQSVNFLVDQSLTIGSSNFGYAKTFLTNYLTLTNDDTSLLTIQYFDTSYDGSVIFGTAKASILAAIAGKSCHCSTNGNLGQSINTTVSKIIAANLPTGIPKFIVALVGSFSFDNVYFAAEYARANSITVIAIAIGASYNNAQLLQAAFTQSNLFYVSSYSTLPAFASQLPNILAHQYIDVAVGSTVIGNIVRVGSNPNYYRIPRSMIANNYYLLKFSFASDPVPSDMQIYESHYDPFPDQYSDCNCSVTYRTSILTYQYYIPPTSGDNIPIKKTIDNLQYLSYAYFAVGGNGLNFNISLVSCTTLSCANEIAAAQVIGSLNYNTKQSENDESLNVNNPTIFTAIGVGLTLLGIGTFASIKGLSKLKESAEELVNQTSDNLATHQDMEPLNNRLVRQDGEINTNLRVDRDQDGLQQRNQLQSNLSGRQNPLKNEQKQKDQSWNGSHYNSDEAHSAEQQRGNQQSNQVNSRSQPIKKNNNQKQQTNKINNRQNTSAEKPEKNNQIKQKNQCKGNEQKQVKQAPVTQNNIKQQKQQRPSSPNKQNNEKKQRPSSPHQQNNEKKQRPSSPHKQSNEKKQRPSSPNKQNNEKKQRPSSPHKQNNEKQQRPSSPHKQNNEKKQRPSSPHKQNNEKQQRPSSPHKQNNEKKQRPSSPHKQNNEKKQRPSSPHKQNNEKQQRPSSPHKQSNEKKQRPSSPHKQNNEKKQRPSSPHKQNNEKQQRPSSPHQQNNEKKQRPSSPHKQNNEKQQRPSSPNKQNNEKKQRPSSPHKAHH